MSGSNRPKVQPGIQDIEAYVPGKSKVSGTGPVLKLSSNETPLGASPKAKAAYLAAAEDMERYPDGSAFALRHAISERYGLDVDCLVCGAGSDELLSLLANAYLGVGDEAIYTQHGFLVYEIAIKANGATPVIAPETNFTADVDAILNCVTDKTKMVFLANPNNPTGTYLPFTEVKRLREGLRDSIILVLDGAYAEYVKANDYEAGISLVSESQNTVMTRTFSKIYGLASLRIGWAYCPLEIADMLNRIRGPFNISSAAIAAGVAAIEDQSHIEQSITVNNEGLVWMRDGLEALGLKVSPSVGNFILIHFTQDAGKTAADADAYLNKQGIILRQVVSYGLPHCLRMTIGTMEDNKKVLAALQTFLA